VIPAPSITEPGAETAAAAAPRRPWLAGAIAVVAVALLLLGIVARSRSAWALLGAGRGLVPEDYYPASGYALVLATTLGQAVGWAIGSALLVYALTVVGLSPTWPRVRLAMAVTYLGLAVLPLLVFHALVGGWLLGLPRAGIEDWLATDHPDARWLLIDAHRGIDVSLIPLAAVFLLALWGFFGDPRRSLAAQTAGALALLGTSLAVALSIAIHSTLVHIRL
jgi:hypothetical protein